MELKIVKLLL